MSIRKQPTMIYLRRYASPLIFLTLWGFSCVLSLPTTAQQQGVDAQIAASVPKELAPELLTRVPADLREPASQYVRLSETAQGRWLQLSPDALRAAVISALLNRPEAAVFLLEHLPKEPNSSLRLKIVDEIRDLPHLRDSPRVRTVLAALVSSDSDAGVIRLALETLRRIEARELRNLLKQRIEQVKSGIDQELLAELAAEDERWISLERGTMLPSFLRKPPPLFAVKPAGKSVRVLAFGDFGVANQAQEKVAAAARIFHRKARFDFGLTVGDNFYGAGMESTSDPRWETRWERLYKPLGIKFYATLGNHDWVLTDSPAAEILYSSKSETWRMPAPYYTYTAGPVQFFALDTNEVSEAQLLWLTEELAKSKARWKIVYGHHPIYVSNTVGPQYTEKMQAKVLPVLKGRSDMYLCGHHHSMQHLKPDGGVHFVVSGGGGRTTYSLNPKDERVLFAQSINGFTVLEANERNLTFRHVSAEGKEVYAYTLSK